MARGRTATGGMATAMGDTTMVRVSRAMGSTMRVTGGTTTRHDDSSAWHREGDGRQDNGGTTTARGSTAMGGTTMAMGSRATVSTMMATSGMTTAMSGTTTRQNKGNG